MRDLEIEFHVEYTTKLLTAAATTASALRRQSAIFVQLDRHLQPLWFPTRTASIVPLLVFFCFFEIVED